jgi:hypothetical protein
MQYESNPSLYSLHDEQLSRCILELSKFVRQNVGLFSAAPKEKQRIESAWKKIHDYVVNTQEL